MPVSVLVEWVTAGYDLDEFEASYHVDLDKLRRAVQYIKNDPPVHVVELTDCPVVERGQSGEPVFKGTTFPVEILFNQIKGGVSARDFADRYGLDYDHIQTVLSYAHPSARAEEDMRSFWTSPLTNAFDITFPSIRFILPAIWVGVDIPTASC